MTPKINLFSNPVDKKEAIVPSSQPKLEVGMKFGNIFDNYYDSKKSLYEKYGEDIVPNFLINGRLSVGKVNLESNNRVLVDAQQHVCAAYLKYSGYDDEKEYIQYSNGFNQYKDDGYGCAKFDTIEILYRDEEGNLKRKYAVDINGNGIVDEGEISDTL